jgi:hypothetical protein
MHEVKEPMSSPKIKSGPSKSAVCAGRLKFCAFFELCSELWQISASEFFPKSGKHKLWGGAINIAFQMADHDQNV